MHLIVYYIIFDHIRKTAANETLVCFLVKILIGVKELVCFAQPLWDCSGRHCDGTFCGAGVRLESFAAGECEYF